MAWIIAGQGRRIARPTIAGRGKPVQPRDVDIQAKAKERQPGQRRTIAWPRRADCWAYKSRTGGGRVGPGRTGEWELGLLVVLVLALQKSPLNG